MHDKINEYVNVLCQQIRWKKARGRVAEEMTTHILDGRDAYIEQGLDEQAATAQAITDTGDAAMLGTNFDRIHRPKPQWGMLIAVAVLLAIGIIASALLPTPPFQYDGGLQRRLIFTAIGVAVMFGTYFLDFTIIGKYSKFIWVVVDIITIILVVLPPSGVGLSNMWLVFSSRIVVSFTNILIFTLLFPLAFVSLIFALRNTGVKGIIAAVAQYGWLCFVASVVSFGTGLFHFWVIGFAILIIAIMKNWFGVNRVVGVLMSVIPFAAVGLFAGGGAGIMRWRIAINPLNDPLGLGFVGNMTRQLLSNARWFGAGSIEIRDQTFYYAHYILPEAVSNSLLTSLIFRHGWLPFIAIVCVLVAFMAAGFRRCFKQRSGLGFFVSFAVMATFSLQVVTYVAFNLGFTLTVITLPLISPGNAALLVNMGLVGFMLSVFRTGDAVTDKASQHTKPSKLFDMMA